MTIVPAQCTTVIHTGFPKFGYLRLIDIQRQLRQFCARGNMFIRKFSFCTEHAEDTKVKLFRTYMSNMYTSHLWSRYTKAAFHKLCVSYNNIFRSLLSLDRRCSASNMFVSRYVNSVPVMQRKFITGFVKRLHASENVILQNIMLSDLRYTSLLGKTWSKLVYHNIDV